MPKKYFIMYEWSLNGDHWNPAGLISDDHPAEWLHKKKGGKEIYRILFAMEYDGELTDEIYG